MGVIHDSVIDARRADSIRDLAFDSLANEGKLSKHVEGNVYWIQFELHWRDYFYYVSQKFSRMRSFNTERLRKARRMAPDSPAPGEAGTASSLFNLGGFQEVLKPHESAKTIDNWKPFDLSDPGDKARLFFQGKTGVPFLDAALREISATGYMSNRMRQNVASYFTVDLYIDWRVAAEWFESLLVDHDVCSNSGNWQYQASGVGLDARASRQFNQIKQANQYDVGDNYVKTWVPALKDVDETFIQTPWCESCEGERPTIHSMLPARLTSVDFTIAIPQCFPIKKKQS
jgi:deoxyribodipyrimidine photo-lyase